jgi:hypothetical protein
MIAESCGAIDCVNRCDGGHDYADCPNVLHLGRRPPPALVVAGLGRCGTSLACQMLAAGGLPVVGSFPDFEVMDYQRGAIPAAVVEARAGQAFKVVDPHRNRPDPGARFATLFLVRDRREQARSQFKLLDLAGDIHMSRTERRHWTSKMDRWERDARQAVAGAPLHVARFEDLIAGQVDGIVDFLAGLNFGRLDAAAMRRQVVARSPACLPDRALEDALVARGSLA